MGIKPYQMNQNGMNRGEVIVKPWLVVVRSVTIVSEVNPIRVKRLKIKRGNMVIGIEIGISKCTTILKGDG